MGWWKINNPEEGRIDWDWKRPQNTFINAVPGKDDTELLYNGDGPADIMSPALKAIIHQYVDAWGRPPKLDELRAVFNFCLPKEYDEERNNKKTT